MRRMIALTALLLMASSAIAQVKDTVNLRGKTQQLNIYGSPANPPVILLSGDLGWAGLVVHVAELLSSRGYYVIGLNSKSYLSSFTTKAGTLKPSDVPGDFKTIIAQIRQNGSAKPMLAGVSEGAGLSVLAATDVTLQGTIQGILALGLPDQNELGWKWQDFTIWITKKTPSEPSFMVEDIISRVSPVPLAEIHSTHDEFLPLEKAKSMFDKAGEPKKMWVIESSNHRFSDSRPELDRRIFEAIEWIHNSAKSR